MLPIGQEPPVICPIGPAEVSPETGGKLVLNGVVPIITDETRPGVTLLAI